MKITLIGAGNLATNLGKALVKGGHSIVEVYSRTMESASALASLTGGVAINDTSKVSNEADVYIFALKDSVLLDAIKQISGNVSSDKVFLHTAGSISIECFYGVAKHYGVLYPMQTFSKERDVEFEGIPCFIESNDNYSDDVIRMLAESISRHIYELHSDKRRYLHLSAVWACNFTNHCYAVASGLLQKCGLPFDVMLPLIDETARKVHEMSPECAQTGPALRYDENVIKAQAELLNGNILLRQIYEEMSMSIHRQHKKQKC